MSSTTRNLTKYLNRHEIEAAVQYIANRINEDDAGKQVVLVGVLKGAILFMADLFVRKLTVDTDVEFVRLSSYGKARTSSGTVTILKDIQADIRGKHVLIVEEIIDSGRTLKFLYERLKQSGPASVESIRYPSRQSLQARRRSARQVRGPLDRRPVPHRLRPGSRRARAQPAGRLLSEY